LYYTASGIITPVGGRPVHRLREKKIIVSLGRNPIPLCAHFLHTFVLGALSEFL